MTTLILPRSDDLIVSVLLGLTPPAKREILTSKEVKKVKIVFIIFVFDVCLIADRVIKNCFCTLNFQSHAIMPKKPQGNVKGFFRPEIIFCDLIYENFFPPASYRHNISFTLYKTLTA